MKKHFVQSSVYHPHYNKRCALIMKKKELTSSSSSLTASIDVPLQLHLGYVQLLLSEWEELQLGDLLLLDKCSYNPEEAKGSLEIFWDDLPLFSAKIKQNSLKLTDYAVCYGDSTAMNMEYSSSFSEGEDSFPDFTEEAMNEEATAESLPEELLEEETEVAVEKQQDSNPPHPMTSLKNVPFPVVVELDRIKISLEKLLELEPGNVLELATHPEQGVYLTVHGKCVARGELLKIGDALGVKITEIATSEV